MDAVIDFKVADPGRAAVELLRFLERSTPQGQVNDDASRSIQAR
ncbi:hypothetical protein [Mycolicibacterium sp. CR10]|nr:hypothetical protein [Mycolicibacterium sp. CR10]